MNYLNALILAESKALRDCDNPGWTPSRVASLDRATRSLIAAEAHLGAGRAEDAAEILREIDLPALEAASEDLAAEARRMLDRAERMLPVDDFGVSDRDFYSFGRV